MIILQIVETLILEMTAKAKRIVLNIGSTLAFRCLGYEGTIPVVIFSMEFLICNDRRYLKISREVTNGSSQCVDV